MRKIAYFIMGPESSGTRMLAQAFCSLGIFGDYEHFQRLDRMDWANAPDRLVFRRSIPHGDDATPPLGEIITDMRSVGFFAVPILILRDLDGCAESQVRHGHASTLAEADAAIRAALLHAFNQCASVGLYPHVVYYDAFVQSPKVRRDFFYNLGLGEPQMQFQKGPS